MNELKKQKKNKLKEKKILLTPPNAKKKKICWKEKSEKNIENRDSVLLN